MEAELAKTFVEAVKVPRDDSPAHQRVINDGEVGAWAAGLRQGAAKSPRYYQLVLLDTIAVDQVSKAYPMKLASGTSDFKITRTTIDPRDWFVSAAFVEDKTGKAGSLDASKVKIEEKEPPVRGNEYKVSLDFSGAGLTAGNDTTVTVTVKQWDELSGLQTGPATIVGMRWREAGYSGPELENRTLNTMLHEPEHAMGLAPSTEVEGGKNNFFYYQDGGHCNNLKSTTYPRGGCVMMHANSTSIVTCPVCSDVLRARNLSALPVSGKAPIP